jgi:hypothetical protein
VNDVIRITGYGTDTTPATASQTNQTSTGPYVTTVGTSIRYAVDTMGGNSGSPIIFEATGVAVGVHTHGGCTSTPGSANSGTSLTLAAFQTAAQGNCIQIPPTSFNLTMTTTGQGTGDLHLQINNVPAIAVEGFTLFSFDTSGPLGQGNAFGLYADYLTIQCIISPLAPGNLLHWTAPAQAGLFPAVPFDLPPGSLPFPAGLRADGRSVSFSAGYSDLTLTNPVRVAF